MRVRPRCTTSGNYRSSNRSSPLIFFIHCVATAVVNLSVRRTRPQCLRVHLAHGRYRISHREVVNLFGDLFAFPLSLGSVVSLQSHVSTALAPVYEQVQTRVQSARVLNIDETGWPAGARRWLWAVVGVMATLFVVANSRRRSVLNSLLGPDYDGIVGSDRARMYLSLPPQRHQLCWAHLIRNVRALSERKGSLAVWAADFLVLSEVVFRLWHAYRGGTLDRGKLAAALEPVQLTLKALLERGGKRYDAAEGLSHELLAHWEALWTFVRVEGVEPTKRLSNNPVAGTLLANFVVKLEVLGVEHGGLNEQEYICSNRKSTTTNQTLPN